ncbi:MAG: ribonuclease Z [Bacteroidetes bacterium]|nr:MAG: ribonuclease Z [Bacteroidota bacterium]
MPFSLTILGSGAALPTSRRNPTAQYLNCNERHILIDCAEGTQVQLRKYGIKFQRISLVLISHLHGDHYFGLIGLLSTMNLLGRTKEIHIFGPEELKGIIELQQKASGHRYAFYIHFHPTKNDGAELIYEDRFIEITSFPLKHRVKTCGFRISEKQKEYTINGELFREDQLSLQAIPFFRRGEDYQDEEGRLFPASKYTFPPKKSASYAYFSDTALNMDNVIHAREADLLYHEATFTQRHAERARATRHATAGQAATFAQAAGVGRLLLGHISSRYADSEEHEQEARAIFENSEVVEDGSVYTC